MEVVRWVMDSSIKRKATQKASVGGCAEERLPERRAARSKSAMAFDKSAA